MTRPPAKRSPAPSLSRWDNEGGAVDPYANALPDGITTRTLREYVVGPYRYTDLKQAIAERDRQRGV